MRIKSNYYVTFATPHLTRVPMNAILCRLVMPLVFSRGFVTLVEGSVSPVKLLSSIAKSIAYWKKDTL